jgi:hypothetical protein
MKTVTDTTKVYEAERRIHHLKRPEFRITGKRPLRAAAVSA